MKQVLIALDQLFNAILGGMADETLSARAYRQYLKGNSVPLKIIDSIFFFDPDHCLKSYQSEVLRKQLPQDYLNEH